MKKIDLSIVIVNYSTKGITLDCLKSVKKNTKGIKYEIILVDNASTDDSVVAIKKLQKKIPEIKLFTLNENLGFAGGNNFGMKKAKGRYILLLNSDTLVNSNVLGEMTHWMEEHPKAGAASCALKNKDGSEQGTGGYFPTLLRVFSWMTIQDFPFVDNFIKPFHPMKPKAFKTGASFYEKEREIDWVTGAFLFLKREVYEAVGGIDEDYFMYTEEVDFQYRIKQAGWQIWYLPRWSIIHLGGASSKSEFPIIQEFKGVKRFFKKFYPKWQMPILKLLLKIGSLGRIVLFGILEGPKSAKIYAKAFKEA